MVQNRRAGTALVFIVLFYVFFSHPAYGISTVKLKVDIDVGHSKISGVSRMDASAGEAIVLTTGTLKIEEVSLNGEPVAYDEFEGTMKVAPEHDGELLIRYSGIFRDNGPPQGAENPVVQNVIDGRGVSLTNVWYPTSGELSRYELSATLPPGYIAVSEAEEIHTVEKDGKVEYQFRFPYVIEGINLVASDKYEIVRDEFRDIGIYAYFFREDKALAKEYIEYTRKYIELYEDLLDMYPYRRFSIVENFLPTGFSMPTYTLLGSSVVNLPFIVKTSLGHEILHQWFGNSVYIDFETGNWAEGLTTYLADHLYKEREGEGREYRKQILIDYMNYVDVERDVPVKYFTGRVDRASRAIGYGKVAMVFHMLKNQVGKKIFYSSLKDFITANRFKKASWNDIRKSFERLSGDDLGWFFTEWTEKEGLFEMDLYGTEMGQKGSRFDLHFHIDQEGDLFKLNLPVTIYFKDRVLFDTLAIDGKENSFDLTLPNKPYSYVIDEDYDVARVLSRNEVPPVTGSLYGAGPIIIVLPSGDARKYEGVISAFEKDGASVRAARDITIADIEENSVIALGIDNPLLRRLYGSIAPEDAGFYIIVQRNPWNREKVVALFHGESKEEVDAAFRKISHYGKYSRLLFDKGVNKEKGIQKSQRGAVMNLDHEARAVEISSIKTLSDVIAGAAHREIIYVGEVHDVFAHHAVQLDVITGVYQKDRKIAIGMEMFQRPFQDTLDRFIDGLIEEEEFLKQSEYFKRWGFDYNLYKPILDFARKEKIRVIALNLEREIIEKVSHEGIDSLSDEEKSKIPPELDFSDEEYRNRLYDVFKMHKDADEKNFDNFYQSQILWDETMSQSVAEFLKSNPGHKMVVLAGQGHLRYGSGIPKRTFRRNGLEYATILIDDTLDQGIADYVVFPKPVEGVTTPKLMVFLNIKDETLEITGFPENSVSEKAGIKSGDVLLSLDGIEMKSIDDIKIFLMGRQKGEVVKVKVLRTDEGREKEMEFNVEL